MTVSQYITIVSVFVLMCLSCINANGELVGYWSFDEADGVKDLSGNGHDGDIHANPLVVEGKKGQALEFNGTDNYIAIPHHKAISELNALSLSAWIQPKKLGSWVAVLEKGIHNNWSYGFFIEADGTLSFYVSTGPAKTLVCCVRNFLLKIDEWSHIFGTYDGKSVKSYVNGKLDGEMGGNGSVHIADDLPFTIGSRNGQNFFAGVVDEVALWNEAIPVEDSMEPLTVKLKGKLTTIWGSIKIHY